MTLPPLNAGVAPLDPGRLTEDLVAEMSVQFEHVASSDQGRAGAHRLCLLGGPYVQCQHRRLSIPEGSKRLLVFVALHGGRVDRRYAAGMLWPDGDDDRASGNLRSALWRLKGAGIDALEADKVALALRPDTEVDVDLLCAWTNRMINGTATPADLRVTPHLLEATDLLPGWYDDWVIFERERLRQRLLHALEALSRRLCELQRWSEAVEVGMTAVNMEPLRESAQVVLVEAHLAEGNVVEVVRCFQAYKELLESELGVSPGRRITGLVQGVWSCSSSTTASRSSWTGGPGLPALPLRR